MTATPVGGAQRFRRDRPCPICGGHKDLPTGKGKRCYGFLSTDGTYAHCTREDRAGGIRPDPDGQTYAHRLHGECRCGQTHGEPTGPTFRYTSNSNGHSNGTGTHRREVARYSYTDEAGHELYHVRRYDPKDFRPYLPGADLPGIHGVRRVTYRLPELMEADPGEFVVAVEGEKDADNLGAEGILATTSQGGAGQCRQWLDPAFVAPLKGQHVVILPDNDQDGERYAATVAQGLAGVAASVRKVRLPNLPPKGDVSDWLAAGGTINELIMLADATAPEVPGEPATNGPDTADEATPNDTEPEPAGRWLDLATVLTLPPPDWLVADILPAKSTAILGGKFGSYKSFLALDLGLCIATGTPWGDHAVEQGAVAYIAAEGFGGLSKRLRAWLIVHQLAPEGIPICFLPAAPNFQDAEAVDQLVSELANFAPPPALIVVDTLARTNAGAEENSAKDMSRYFEVCQQLQQVTGACVLVLHHPTKNGDSLRGSGAILGAADTIIGIERPGLGPRITVSCQKQKDAGEFAPLYFQSHEVDLGNDESSLVLQPYEPDRATSKPANDQEQKAYAALLRLGKRVGFNEWERASEMPHGTFTRAVKGLEIGGLAWKDEHKKYVFVPPESGTKSDPDVDPDLVPPDADDVEREWYQ